MSTTRYVTLIRHAQSISSGVFKRQSFGDPLSVLGKKQAALLARSFASRHIRLDTLCASPMRRAQETAEIIATSNAIQYSDICIIDEAQERKVPSCVMNLHTQSSESQAIINEVFQAWLQDPYKQVYDEETYASLMTRVKSVKRQLLTFPGTHLLLVTHATFMKAFLNDVLHVDRSTPETFLAIYHSRDVANTGVSHFSYSDEVGWQLISWNDSSHLAATEVESERE